MNYGVYIHIPYCVQKCPYCDFYSIAYTQQSALKYTQALLSAIESYRGKGLCADTVYFGGGTPNLIGSECINSVLKKLRECLKITDDAEITMEANPETLSRQNLSDFAKAGINRLSLGLQSANPKELKSLGRRHTPEQAAHCVSEASAAGIKNISLDLMMGIEGQTQQSLLNSIDFCTDLGATHISAYMLKIEPETPFYKKRALLNLPDDDQTALLYLSACAELEKRGYAQYEISNFAKDGKVSRHNLKYWQCGEYIGLGAAAHGFENGRRYYYPRSVKGFITAPLKTICDGEGGSAEEAFMLGLRLCKGVDLAKLKTQFGITFPDSFFSKLKQLKKAELLEKNGENIFLTPKGFLVSNSIISELLRALDLI